MTGKKHIVVSAVNIRKGGTLTVLRDCLGYLSQRKDCTVTAIVHRKDLCEYPGIEYIEIPRSAKGWGRRLWCEYVTLGKISERMENVPDLWLSLHDTTPRVKALRQAVYCHTSFPFMKIRGRDFRMDAKIPLFSMFTGFAYKLFCRRNDYMIVQQEWFRDGLSSITGFPKEKIIVCPPSFKGVEIPDTPKEGTHSEGVPIFFYPSTPDCHKNFELLCQAASILEKRIGTGKFKVVLTLSGKENRYASYLKNTWRTLSSVDFHGFMSREELGKYYSLASCLVFPSRIETWGLPISEFGITGKPMILSDLPYAHETASGQGKVSFCSTEDPEKLSFLMEEVISGDMKSFSPVGEVEHHAPYASSWESLFGDYLLAGK